MAATAMTTTVLLNTKQQQQASAGPNNNSNNNNGPAFIVRKVGDLNTTRRCCLRNGFIRPGTKHACRLLLAERVSAVSSSSSAAADERSSPLGGFDLSTAPSAPESDKLSDQVRFKRDVRHLQRSSGLPDAASAPLHLHFGAGKLGLGLVVPALEESGTTYAIVQRPSADWADVAEPSAGYSSVNLRINGEDIVSHGLRLITDHDIAAAQAEGKTVMDLIGESEEGQGHLILTGDKSINQQLTQASTSFSCALGAALPKVLGPLLGSLPKRSSGLRPTLYACENDLESVETLAAEICGAVEVVPCMVDRICSARTVTAGGDAAVIDVEAEHHTGSIVLLEQSSQSLDDMPLDGDTVHVPETEEVADYLFVQKKRLVNSMHTVLAFTTLVENGKSKKTTQSLPQLPLLNYAEADDAVKKQIWAWAVAQILVLMKEKGVDVMAQAHSAGTESELVHQMLAVARETLDRFSSIEDTTSRVLGGGVSNRYHTRLVPVQEGMHLVQAMVADLPLDCCQRQVLEASGLQLTDIVTACDSLVDSARVFAELDEQEMEHQQRWDEMRSTLNMRISSLTGVIPNLGRRSMQLGAMFMAAFAQLSQDNY